MLIAALFILTPKCHQPKCPSRMHKKIVLHNNMKKESTGTFT